MLKMLSSYCSLQYVNKINYGNHFHQLVNCRCHVEGRLDLILQQQLETGRQQLYLYVEFFDITWVIESLRPRNFGRWRRKRER